MSSHNRNLTAERRTVLLPRFPVTSDDYSITLAAAPVNTATIVHFALKDGDGDFSNCLPEAETKDGETGEKRVGEENRRGRQRRRN